MCITARASPSATSITTDCRTFSSPATWSRVAFIGTRVTFASRTSRSERASRRIGGRRASRWSTSTTTDFSTSTYPSPGPIGRNRQIGQICCSSTTETGRSPSPPRSSASPTPTSRRRRHFSTTTETAASICFCSTIRRRISRVVSRAIRRACAARRRAATTSCIGIIATAHSRMCRKKRASSKTPVTGSAWSWRTSTGMAGRTSTSPTTDCLTTFST